MTIKDQAGTVHTITEDDYLQAVKEDGPDHWWQRWLNKGASVTDDGAFPWKEAAQQNVAEAFMYVDGVVHWGKAHWIIVDKLWGDDLSKWVYAMNRTPIVSGWMWEGPLDDLESYNEEGRHEAVVELWSEFAPDKQEHLEDPTIIPKVIAAIEESRWVNIVDLETPDQPKRILERFTPSINQGKDELSSVPEEDTYVDFGTEEGVTGITVLKKTDLSNGGEVSTTDLRAFGGGFETIVVGIPKFKGVQYSDDTSDAALATHEMLVAAADYNRLTGEKNIRGAHITECLKTITAEQLQLFNAPGLSIVPVSPAREDAHHEYGERPFIYYRPLDTIFEATTDCHHADILEQIQDMIEEAQNGVRHTETSLNQDNWIWGDITDEEQSGNHWIKFISGWPIPLKVVEYFDNKYPGRKLVYAGETLPWNKLSFTADPEYYRENDLLKQGAFAFMNGNLIRAHTHHQGIMNQLLKHGWTWVDMMTVPQAWGWFTVEDYFSEDIPRVSVRFTSDAAIQTEDEIIKAKAAFANAYQLPVIQQHDTVYGYEHYDKQYGRASWERNYGEGGYYENADPILQGEIPPPPTSEELARLNPDAH
jgi:hypothetical protein